MPVERRWRARVVSQQPLIRSAIYAGYACTALLSLASALIFFAVLSNDFSLKYVHQNSDAAMPWFFKITSYWGGLDGSMMFWAWLLSIFATVAISSQSRAASGADSLGDGDPDGHPGVFRLAGGVLQASV
jgi:cytochrome c biogenesis factor